MQFTTIMAFNGSLEAERADAYPNIRFFTVGDGTTSATPLQQLATIQQPWTAANNASIGGPIWTVFSAVCWLTARDIYDGLGGTVPLGLVSSNWGGTRIAAWSSPATNAACNSTVEEGNSEALPETGMAVLQPPVTVGGGAGPDPNTASVLYNAMVVPYLVGPMAVKAITWFQGESDGNTPSNYACMFPALISQWKSQFSAGLSPAQATGAAAAAVGPEPWFGFIILEPWVGGGGPQLRDAQMRGLTVNYTGYGSAIDIGDPTSPFVSYHPRAKQVPSARLAAAALSQVYGVADQQWTGAVFESAAGSVSPDGGSMVVTVTMAPGSGKLVIKDRALLDICPIILGVSPQSCAWPQLQASVGAWVNATLSVSADGSQLIFTAPAPAPGAKPVGVSYGYGVWPALSVYSDYAIDTGYEVVDFPLLQFNATVDSEATVEGPEYSEAGAATLPSASAASRLLQPSGCPNGGVGTAVWNSTAAAAWEAQPLQNTSSKTGRPLRLLEPPDGFALSGAGQDPYDYAAYSTFMAGGDPANVVPPALFMTYLNLDSLNTTTPGEVPSFFTGLLSTLGCYGDDDSATFLVPQLGLAMTDDDGSGTVPPYDGKVAAGEYDYAISQLVVGLKALGGRPVLMRIGYEFNGIWNNYNPSSFIAAWIRIWDAVKADPTLASSVAFVWDYSCDEPDNPWTSFELPDDKYVDWYGVNPFSKCPPNSKSYPGGCSAPNNASVCLQPFIDYARKRGYPVLFAESTPRYIGGELPKRGAAAIKCASQPQDHPDTLLTLSSPLARPIPVIAANASNGAWDQWFGPYLDLVTKSA